MAVWLAGGGGDRHHDAVHIRVETHHLDLHFQRGSRGSPCLQNLSGIICATLLSPSSVETDNCRALQYCFLLRISLSPEPFLLVSFRVSQILLQVAHEMQSQKFGGGDGVQIVN